MIQNGQLITYKGDCDVIRTGKGFSWKEFAGDGIELIVGIKLELVLMETMTMKLLIH